MKILRQWLNNARYVALPQSLLPAIVAVCLAAQQESFSIAYSFLAIIGVTFAHLGLNLFDDYFDAKKNDSSYRDLLKTNGFRARIGKCSYLKDGSTSLKKLFWVAFSLLAMALLIGIFITLKRSSVILIIVIIAGLLGISYSSPPLRLSYHYLGEIIVGILFGPLLMMGTYLAACSVVNYSILLSAFPIGILIANISYTHSILDFIPDKEINKKTLAVGIGKKELINFVSALFIFLPYIIIVVLVLFSYLSPYYLLTFISLPTAFSLFRSILAFQRHPDVVPVKKWYHFPMEKWCDIEAAGIEWFMIRWYSARNLLIFFCLIYAGIGLFNKI